MINHNPPIPRTTPENHPGLRALSEALAPLHNQAWMDDAACAEIGPSFEELTTNQQKRVCRGCRTKPECLAYALADPNLIPDGGKLHAGLPVVSGRTYHELFSAGRVIKIKERK